MHLRTKLTLGILAANLVAFLAVGFVAIPTAKIALRDRIDDRLRADLPAVRASILTPRGRVVPGALGPVGDLGDREYALILVDRSRARVLATSGSPGAPDPPPELAGVRGLARGDEVAYAQATDGSKYRYVTVRLGDGRALAVAAPVDDLRELVDELIRTFSLIAIAGSGALALLSWWWIRRSTRPIERLTERADAIATGDDDRRLTVPTSTAELRRLAQALDAMVASVDASLAARTQSEARLREFVANASHELRTPLTSVSGYLQLDLDGALADDEQHRHSMSRALAEASRMRRIVADLQLLTELDEDVAPVTSEIDLNDLVRKALHDASAVDPARTWTLKSADRPLLVDADADQLHQVIANLLHNVRIHTPPGTGGRSRSRPRSTGRARFRRMRGSGRDRGARTGRRPAAVRFRGGRDRCRRSRARPNRPGDRPTRWRRGTFDALRSLDGGLTIRIGLPALDVAEPTGAVAPHTTSGAAAG